MSTPNVVELCKEIAVSFSSEFKIFGLEELKKIDTLKFLLDCNHAEAKDEFERTLRINEKDTYLFDFFFRSSNIASTSPFKIIEEREIIPRIVDVYHSFYSFKDDEAVKTFNYRKKNASLVSNDVAVERIESELKKLGLSFLGNYMMKSKTYKQASLVLAGGFVCAARMDQLMFEYITEQTVMNEARNPEEKSDLDFFVIGEDEDAKRKLFRRIILEISSIKGIIMSYYGAVFRFHGFTRDVQIIFSSEKDIEGLLSQFDMSHIQCAYFNKHIFSTVAHELMTPYNKTLMNSRLQSPYRMNKALRRGFMPVYDTNVHRLKGQYSSDSSYFKNGDQVEIDSYFITGPRIVDVINVPDLKGKGKEEINENAGKAKNTILYYPIMRAGEKTSFESYCNEKKRDDIPWASINISEAVALTENLEALRRGYSNYVQMSTTLPVSYNNEDSIKSGICSLDVFDCKINSLIKGENSLFIMGIEGFVKVKDITSFKDEKVKEAIMAKFLEKEEKMAASREYWTKVFARDSKILYEEIAKLSAQKEISSSEKCKIKELKGRVRSLLERFNHAHDTPNIFDPNTIKEPQINSVVNNMDVIKGEELFESQFENLKNIGPFDGSAIAEILYNHPHGKVFSRKSLKNPGNKVVSMNLAVDIYSSSASSASSFHVKTSNGMFLPIEEAAKIPGLRFNMKFHVNGHQLLIPPFKANPEKDVFPNYAKIGQDFFELARKYYSDISVTFKTNLDFFERFSIDLKKDKKLQNILSESLYTGPKREKGLPGKPLQLSLNEAFLIKN